MAVDRQVVCRRSVVRGTHCLACKAASSVPIDCWSFDIRNWAGGGAPNTALGLADQGRELLGSVERRSTSWAWRLSALPMPRARGLGLKPVTEAVLGSDNRTAA